MIGTIRERIHGYESAYGSRGSKYFELVGDSHSVSRSGASSGMLLP